MGLKIGNTISGSTLETAKSIMAYCKKPVDSQTGVAGNGMFDAFICLAVANHESNINVIPSGRNELTSTYKYCYQQSDKWLASFKKQLDISCASCINISDKELEEKTSDGKPTDKAKEKLKAISDIAAITTKLFLYGTKWTKDAKWIFEGYKNCLNKELRVKDSDTPTVSKLKKESEVLFEKLNKITKVEDFVLEAYVLLSKLGSTEDKIKMNSKIKCEAVTKLYEANEWRFIGGAIAFNQGWAKYVNSDGKSDVGHLINNLTGENIELTAKEGEVWVKTDNQEFKLKTLPAEEFPTVPETTKTPKFNIKSSELKQALMQSVYAVSLNQTQPEISGVFMSSDSGEVVVVATDRYRLVERKLAGPDFPSVIIPHKTIQEVIRLLSGFAGEVGVEIEENQIFFNIGEVVLISRLVDGQYPDYKSIFPESFVSQVVVDKEKLQNALKTTALLSQSTNSVKLEFLVSKQQIVLSSQSEGLGSGVASLGCEVKGEDGSLLLNYKYVLDFLSQVEETQVELKINNDSSPAVFSPLGSKQYNYLVMPIKI
jgi:DNA polymerase-3 subunit beta